MGSYRQVVEQRLSCHPSLWNLSQFLARGQLNERKSRIRSLAFLSSGNPILEELKENELHSVVGDGANSSHSCGSIILIEDVSRTVIDILGSVFALDPHFFAGHIHAPAVALNATYPQRRTLPSLERGRNFFNIHYHRTVIVDNVSGSHYKAIQLGNVARKIVLLPSLQQRTVGIIQHCCSLALTQNRFGRWTCIVLLDPPTENIRVPIDRNSECFQTLRTQLLQGGYDDFIRHDIGSDHAGLRRERMLDDIIRYWFTEKPISFNAKNPSLLSLCYYPLRIVAAEWIIYMDLAHISIKQYEYNLDHQSVHYEKQLNLLHNDLRSLQRWRRRGMATSRKLSCVIRFIKTQNDKKQEAELSEPLLEDFHDLQSLAEDHFRHLGEMVPVVTSLISIVDARRSFVETSNITRLTYLALIFIPLTYVATLFSMNADLGPGSGSFWIYFATAIPITLLVVLLSSIPLSVFQRIATNFQRTDTSIHPQNATTISSEKYLP